MLHTSNDIRNPGLRTLPPGVERYFVKGGGLSIIEVSPEDKIEIINEEGKQICEIIVFNSKNYTVLWRNQNHFQFLIKKQSLEKSLS